MDVVAVWRYPIKAMLGESVSEAPVSAAGLEGDRRWVVIDRNTGERVANKRGRTDERLQACRAELHGGDRLENLQVALPDGSIVRGADIESALSDLLGADLGLEAAGTGDSALGAPSAHHDFAAIHLLTTGTLATLRSLAPACDWDPRRFRPNLLLADDCAPGAFREDDLIGAELRGRAGLRLKVALPTPRCVVPTRATEELPHDPRILRTAAQRHRVDLGPFGRAACVGAYAEVVDGGEVRVGDQLRPDAGGATPRGSLSATLDELVGRFGT